VNLGKYDVKEPKYRYIIGITTSKVSYLTILLLENS